MSNHENLRIEELETKDLHLAFPLISQLRSGLSLAQCKALVEEMKATGYRIFCLFAADKMVAYAGFAKQANLYYGSYVWVYDLVTDEAERGRGYGAQLLSHVETWARAQGVSAVVLSSGLKRERAHKFYEKSMEYDIVSYVFKKNL